MPAHRSIEVDESRWPLVLAIVRGVPTPPDMAAYIDAQERALNHCEKFAVVVDATESGAVPSLLRARLSDWQDKRADLLRHFRIGTAFAASVPLIRGAIVLWAQRLPNEYVIVSTRAEAEAWAVKRLHAAGLAPAWVSPQDKRRISGSMNATGPSSGGPSSGATPRGATPSGGTPRAGTPGGGTPRGR